MAKSKTKTAYVCGDCGAEHRQWQGQCLSCEAWNTLSRVTIGPIAEPGLGYTGATAAVQRLGAISAAEAPRFKSGFAEFDRVLGGGLVPGSVVLIGGDPGAGKSTLLLQVCCKLALAHEVLYLHPEYLPFGRTHQRVETAVGVDYGTHHAQGVQRELLQELAHTISVRDGAVASLAER